MFRVARLVTAAMALVVASCGSPAPSALATFDPDVVLVVENRTTSTVAFASDPVLVFAPCSESAVTQDAIDMALARVNERVENDEPTDIPPGAVDFTHLAVARPDGSTYPGVVIIDSTGTKVVFEPFDRAALPACGGVASRPGASRGDDASPGANDFDRPLLVANRDDHAWTIRVSDALTTWGYWIVPANRMIRLASPVVPRSDLRVVTVDEVCRVVTKEPWGDIPTDVGGPVGAAVIDLGDVLTISLDRLAEGPFAEVAAVPSSACPK